MIRIIGLAFRGYIILYTLLFVFISGCQNPLDQSGSGKSKIAEDFNPFLEGPGIFEISSVDVEATSATVYWEDSERAQTYLISYGQNPGNYSDTKDCTSPCLIEGLSPGTNYFFRVTARNSSGIKISSNEFNAMTIVDLTAPSSLSLSPGLTDISLNWSVAGGSAPITYSIYRSLVSGSGFTKLVDGISTTNYTDSAVVAVTTYYYKVLATNSSGDIGFSNEVSGYLQQLPSVPAGLAVQSGTGLVDLSWNPSTGGGVTYIVSRGTSSGGPYTVIATSVSSTSYSDNTAAAGTSYYYVVKSTNAAGTSSNSSEINAVSLGAFSISSVQASASGNLQITWGASTGASGYALKYGTTSGSYTTTLSNQTSPRTLTGLTPGVTYYFLITAYNAFGSANSGNEFSGIPLGSFSISSVAASSGQAILTFGTSPGASSYTVKYGTSSGSYTTTYSTSATSPITVSGLANGTTYYFMVNAGNLSGNLNATAEATGSPIAVPTVPASFTGNPGVSQVSLSWGASTGSGTITYEVLRSSSSGGPYTSLSSGISSTSYSDLTAVNGSTYYYVVRSNNAGGNSAYSTEIVVTPIGSVSISSVILNGGGGLKLTWTTSTGASSYSVKYGTSSGVYTTTLTNQTSPTTITGLSGGTTYYFVVDAVNVTGSISSAESIGIPIDSLALTSVVAAVSGINVTWNSVSGATSYDISYDTSSHLASDTYASSSNNKTSPTLISGLTVGTAYYARVVAKNSYGNIVSSNELSAIPVSLPSTPGSLNITPSLAALTLNWTASTGTSPITYSVYRSTSSGAGFAKIADTISATSYSDTTPVAATTYYYKVLGSNVAGDGPYSSEISSALLQLPTVPTALTATTGLNVVNLSWASSTGGTITYEVSRGTSAGGPYTSLSTGISGTSYSDTTGTPGVAYYYVVKAVNSEGSSANSTETSATSLSTFAISSVQVSGAATLQVAWSASNGASSYTVKYGTSAGSYSTTLTNQTSPVSIASLTPGTTYYFMVTAVNAKGSTDATSELSGVPLGSFSISSVAATSGQALVTFGSSAGANSYTLKYGTSTGNYPTTFSSAATSPTLVTGLTNGVTYYFMVSSINSSGSLNSSAEITGSPIAIPTVPASFVGAAGISHSLLSWAASTGSGSITYEVLRSASSGGPYTSLSSSIATTTYSDLTALDGTTYYYVVRSSNAGGNSAYSTEVSVKPIAAINISSVTVNGAGVLDITWAAATGATSYNLKYGTTTSVYTTTLTGQTSPKSISGLTPGVTYYFQVDGINSTGSVGSSESSGIPLGAFSMSSMASASGGINISWAGSSGATTYDIIYDTSSHSASGTYVSSSTNNTSPATLGSLTTGTTYYARIRANNSSGSLVSTNELSAVASLGFTLDIPYDALTSTSYNWDDSSITDLSGGVVELTPNISADNVASSFAGGTTNGTQFNSYLRLQSSTNVAELDSSWAPQWSNIVMYLKFNETSGSTLADSSPLGTNTATIDSSCTKNASNPKVNVGINSTLITCLMYGNVQQTNPTTYTLMAWIKSTTTRGGGIVGFSNNQDNSSTVYDRTIYMSNPGNINYGIYSSGANRIIGTPLSYNDGNWHHVAATQGATGMNLYVDGQLIVSNATYTTPFNYNGYWKIGRNLLTSWVPLPTWYTFSGNLDEVVVWNKELTAAEVQVVYRRQAPDISGVYTSRIMDAKASLSWTNLNVATQIPFLKELPSNAASESSTSYPQVSSSLTNGLIGLWHFNEASGTSAANSIIDSSGSGYHATPTSGRFGDYGLFGTAATFDGTSSYITTSMPMSALANGYTLSAWAKTSITISSATWNWIFAAQYWFPSKWFQCGRKSTTGDVLYDSDSYTNMTSSISSSGKNITDGKWHHIACVWDRTNGKKYIYIDGKQEAISTAATVNDTTTAYGNLLIGAHGVTSSGATSPLEYWRGQIDEAAVWNRPLSAAEVLNVYRRGINLSSYQIRTCTTSNCSDQSATTGNGWKGPDGTHLTYFSELYNTSTSSLGGAVNTTGAIFTFSSFSGAGLSVSNSRYIQYRVILDSNDPNTSCTYNSSAATCSPEIQSITLGPTHYDTTDPSVTSKSTIGQTYISLDASGFTQTLGSGGCTGARYTLSANGTTFYYFNGTAWAISDGTYALASSAAVIAANISTLVATMGTGTLQIKTFLHSDGVTACEVSNVQIRGLQ